MAVEGRNMTRAESLAYLAEDGGFTPGCIYGSHSDDCAPVAYALAEIFAEANGDWIDRDLLDGCMSSVVNSEDGVRELIEAHGTAEHRELIADRLEDWQETGGF